MKIAFIHAVYIWSPTYNGYTYEFFTLLWCKSNMHSVETVLEFCILVFSGLVISGTIVSGDTGQ